jgi:alkylation response protein AidB-like acyl-CoA dehydrogenase
VHRARALAPFLRERAAQTEADRRRNLDAIRNGAPTERALRTRSTASWGYATRLLCKAVDALTDVSGARGMRDQHPIQRAWRDLHAIAAHVALNPDASGQARGRFLLGLPRDPKATRPLPRQFA